MGRRNIDHLQDDARLPPSRAAEELEPSLGDATRRPGNPFPHVDRSGRSGGSLPVVTMDEGTNRSKVWLWTGGLTALVLALQIAGFHDLRHDDAYITYRYGQNLAEGRGLVFNPGERIMGSTSPLHALLAGGVHAVVGHEALPSVMSALGCVGWTLQALAVFFLLHGALGRLWAFLVALCIAAGGAWSFEWVALETHLAAAFTLWALVAGVSSRWTWAAALLALAGLTRPDAYLLGIPLGLLAVPEARRGDTPIVRPLAAFAAITLPWLIFAWSYFGTVLPQSVAKVGRTPPASYLRHLLEDPAVVLFFSRAGPVWTVLTWVLAGAGAYFLVSRNRRLWVLPAYGLLHFGAYELLRPFTRHRWHLYPLGLVVVILALSAVAAAGRFEPRRLIRPIAAVALLLFAFGYAQRSVRWADYHQDGYWWGSRDRAYQAAAAYLREHGDPQKDLLAAVEVGTLAYYSDFRVFDLGGLVTRIPQDRDDWPTLDWYVTYPEYLGFARGLEPEAVYQSGEFRAYVFRLSERREPP